TAAALLPVVDAAVEHGADVHALGGEHARGDAGAGAAGADRDDGPRVVELLAVGAREPVRDVPATWDVAVVALVLLADVEHLDRVLFDEALQLLDPHRLQPVPASE